jgi:hypothetical protein
LSCFGSATTMSLANSSLCHTRVSLLRTHKGFRMHGMVVCLPWKSRTPY